MGRSSLSLGGTCGQLIASIDWSKTPLGSMDQWPPALAPLVQTMLAARHPMLLFWGPELIQFYNDAFLPSFGEGKHPAAMGQQAEVCWAEIWEIIGPETEGVMSNGTPTWHDDAPVPIHRNGRIEEAFWIYGYSPAYDENGNIAGILIICTETTSGVLAHRRSQLLARVAAIGMAATDPKELVTDVLALCEKSRLDLPWVAAFVDEPAQEGHQSFGLEVADLAVVRETVDRRAHPQRAESLELARSIDAEPWPEPTVTMFVVPYLNREIAFGLSPRLPFDDAYEAFLVQLVDTLRSSQRRLHAAEQRLQTERERRDLLMQAPVAAALLEGPELVYTLANPHYLEMVGREVLGKPYLEAFPEAAGTPVWDIVNAVRRDGIPFSTDEMCVEIDRDGSGSMEEAFFKFNLEPIRGPDGEVSGLMVLALDITEIVMARRSNERTLDERAALVHKLEEASRAKDEFLAMLGHELRNPLSPIVTALQILKMRDPSAFGHELEIIERQASHLVRLVDDLLDVARIVRGKIELQKEACDIKDVVTRAVEMAEVLLEKGKHNLSIDMPPSISWWGDPSRLAQIVSNLLTNAARYTPPGGDIRLSVAAEPHGLCIQVTDNGVGIEPEMLPRIFDLFTQGRQELGRTHGGLGLGLTLTKNLVVHHGGTITAHSDGPGMGSSFEVRLPVLETAQAGDSKSAEAPTTPGLRILVVDDNTDAADTLGAILKVRGHHVEVAYDGLDGLAAFEAFRPKVALLDIGLPVMDGYELAARILETPAGRQCRLIALTGYGQASDRARTAAAGFHTHLVKPVDLAALSAAMADLS